jgi:hypothetical protein
VNSKIRNTLVAAGTLVMALSLQAAEAPKPTPAKLSAAQIVDRNVAARGGLEGWRKVKTMSYTGKLDAGRARRPQTNLLPGNRKVKFDPQRDAPKLGAMIQLPFRMDLARGRKQHMEVEFQGQKAVQVYDGEHGWKLRPFIGRHEVENFTADESKSAAQDQDLDGFLIDSQAKGSKVALEGTEKIEDRDNYRLQVTLKNGDVRHVWVDAQTFLETKIDGTRKMDGKQRPMETYFRDYKEVEGLKFPMTLETRVKGVADSQAIHVERVALNPAFAADHFTQPR